MANEKVGPTVSSFNDMSTKITKPFIMLSAPCMMKFVSYRLNNRLHEHFFASVKVLSDDFLILTVRIRMSQGYCCFSDLVAQAPNAYKRSGLECHKDIAVLVT